MEAPVIPIKSVFQGPFYFYFPLCLLKFILYIGSVATKKLFNSSLAVLYICLKTSGRFTLDSLITCKPHKLSCKISNSFFECSKKLRKPNKLGFSYILRYSLIFPARESVEHT